MQYEARPIQPSRSINYDDRVVSGLGDSGSTPTYVCRGIKQGQSMQSQHVEDVEPESEQSGLIDLVERYLRVRMSLRVRRIADIA